MALNKGEIAIEVLSDGRIKAETGDMGGPNHKAADDFLALVQTLMGGEVTSASTKHNHSHHHTHTKNEVGHKH